jgi:hypothetical protein
VGRSSAGAGLGARAGTDVAGDRHRYPDLRGLAGEGFFQRDFHVVAQIGAALATAERALPLPAAAHHLAEDVFEDIGEAAAAAKTAATAAHAAMLEGCMTVTVIGRALLRILQRLVGFVDFLELVLAM